MATDKREKRKRYCIYLGCSTLIFTQAVSWYWGNLSAYTISYYRATFGPDSGFETPWVISSFLAAMALGMPISNILYKLPRKKWAWLLVCLTFDASMFLSYFFVQFSCYTLVITIGITCGLTSGILNGTSLLIVREWTPPKHLGTFTAIVLSSKNIGPLVINQVITHFINPKNLLPDLKDKDNVYFTQAEVLNRVPSVFLVVGAVSTISHLLGMLLLSTLSKDRGCTHEMGDACSNQQEYELICKSCNYRTETSYLNSSESHNNENIQSQPYVQDKSLGEGKFSELEPNINGMKDTRSEMELNSKSSESNTCKNDPKKNDDIQAQQSERQICDDDLTVFQLLKTRPFYVLWLINMCSDLTFMIMSNYYKIFGQVKIHDDHFLTDIWVVVSVVSMHIRVLWGYLIDRLGVKYSFMIASSSLSIGSVFWYFTAINKWLYMFWTTLYASFNSSLYILFPVATLKVFGSTHYTRNYGMILTATLIVSNAGPPIIDLILSKGNYFTLFMTGGVLHLVGMTLFLIVFPKY